MFKWVSKISKQSFNMAFKDQAVFHVQKRNSRQKAGLTILLKYEEEASYSEHTTSKCSVVFENITCCISWKGNETINRSQGKMKDMDTQCCIRLWEIRFWGQRIYAYKTKKVFPQWI